MTRAPLGLVLIAALAGGCLDVRQVDTSGTALVWSTSRTVDDAEQSDAWPSWSLLRSWYCWSGARVDCGRREPGHDDRGHARFLEFDEQPAADTYAHAGLATPGVVQLDLSGYDGLTFLASLEPNAASAWPERAELRFQLNCPGIDTTGLHQQGEETVGLASAVALPPGAGWQTFSFALEDFIQPNWQTWQRIDPASCLRHVSDLGFVVATNALGERLAGTLLVDDLELRTTRRPREPAGPQFSLSPWLCVDALGVRDPSCDSRLHDATVTLGAAPDSDGALAQQSQCASVVAADNGAEQPEDSLDWSSFDDLALTATFSPSPTNSRRPGRFAVRLRCFSTTNHPASVLRSFQVSPGLGSYRLALASFTRDSLQALPCIAHVDGVCLETVDETAQDAAPGTLSASELVLR